MMKKKTPPVYFRYLAELSLSRKLSVEKVMDTARMTRRLVSLEELVPGHVISLGKSKKPDWVIESIEPLPGNFPEFGDWPVAQLDRPWEKK